MLYVATFIYKGCRILKTIYLVWKKRLYKCFENEKFDFHEFIITPRIALINFIRKLEEITFKI